MILTICSNALHVIAVYKTICNFVRTKFGWAEGGTEGFVRPNRYFINVAGQLQKAATSPLSCLGETCFCDSNDSCDRHGVICCWTYSIPLVSRIFPNLPCSNSGHHIMPSRMWWTSTLPVPYPSPARFEGGSLGFDGIRVKTETRFNFHVHNMQYIYFIFFYNISFCLCSCVFPRCFSPCIFLVCFSFQPGIDIKPSVTWQLAEIVVPGSARPRDPRDSRNPRSEKRNMMQDVMQSSHRSCWCFLKGLATHTYL